MNAELLKNILVVDDDDDILEIVQLSLTSVGGFSVEVCHSGQELLDKGSSFSPQLILLDVMMPGLDGPSTFQKLRQIPKFATTPVVFLTAKTQSQEVEKYQKLGAVDIITKPFDPMTLSETVQSIWSNLKEKKM